MAELKLEKMSPAAFLQWQLGQDKLYELVDGIACLPAKMMTGATRNHDRVTVNALATLYQLLKDNTCQPCTDDVAVQIPAGNIRRPDLLVDCSEADPKDMIARHPVLVIEVLSPSTMRIDRFRKLEEYKTVNSLRYILLVDTQAPQVTLYQRLENNSQWDIINFDSLEDSIKLPDLDISLTLTDLYNRVRFDDAV